MSVPFTAPFSLLFHHLTNLSPDAMECFVNEKPAIKVSPPMIMVNVCRFSHQAHLTYIKVIVSFTYCTTLIGV